ncbi:hypothetical protein YPPY03_1346, partial [Yersinia pestis PY-03]
MPAYPVQSGAPASRV